MKPGSHLTWEDSSMNHGAMEGMIVEVMIPSRVPTFCGISEERIFGW
jgi:hypothetical protein